MWFWEKILAVLTYPIHWFWESYEEYKEEENVWKIILLFVGSLSGVIIIGFALVLLTWYLIEYHMPLLIAITLIIWIYAYVKSTLEEKIAKSERKLALSQEMADKGYPIMRNIMYQTLKNCADAIGGISPRLLQEIEVLETHYIISNNICFYQFKLNKSDFSMMYNQDDLTEFKRILQVTLSRKVQAGEFPRQKFENVVDAYGNIYDPVCIDMIEDIDTFFIIQTVFTTPEYADYSRNREINKQNANNQALNVEWKDIS